MPKTQTSSKKTASVPAVRGVSLKRIQSQIQKLGSNARQIYITYTRKRDRKKVTRLLNPYEIKPHKTSGSLILYAADSRFPKHIKAYLVSNISQVKGTKQKFMPIWTPRL